MISYREKQLMMVMKMLQDDTAELADAVEKSAIAIKQGSPAPCALEYRKEPVTDYQMLVDIAESSGYDLYIRASDLLSPDELSDLKRRKAEIDQQFKELTRLDGPDYAFLITAILLQITRQALHPRLDFETLLKKPSDRENANKTAQAAEASSTKEKVQESKNRAARENGVADDDKAGKQEYWKKDKKWYYASVKDISDIHHVPYDANGPGLSGHNHRYKTLGHDPWLGYFFGSCNILTNTLTTNKMITFHVKNGHTSGNGDIEKTAKMIHYSCERFKEKGGKPITAIALAKQAYHIQTDVKSKKGIPLPFLELFLDEKTIEKLCSMGIDYNAAQFVGEVATQAFFAEMINFIIATAHRILVAKEEYEKYCADNNLNDEKNIIAALKHKGFHDIIWGNESLNEVRTRKILLISNAVASCANVIYVGIASGISTYTGNAEGVNDALSKLDVGGILVTLKHLFSDGRVITKIHNDFIHQIIMDDFNAKLEAIEKGM